jgi:hypothetical protein
MKKIKETIVENSIKNYYGDDSIKTIERKTLSNYTKDNLNIEVLEFDLLRENSDIKTNYNTIVRIFENSRLENQLLNIL